MKEEKMTWINILSKLYKNLHMSKGAMRGMSENDKKRDRIVNYFERLEKIHTRVINGGRDNDLKILKHFYYDLYIIKPEDIPDKYFENEQRIARERGYGNIEITPERKKLLINQIIEDQKKSLEPWIDYFLFDEESKSYEIWEKYWVFQGLQQLGKFNKETMTFSKRDRNTVYPFPPVDKEAVFETIKLMEEYIKDKKGDEEIRSVLGAGNFKTLYEYSMKQILNKNERKNTNTTEGIWIKYDQGSDYNILRNSLQGYYTGWCTAAGENFAKTQLEGGDFYVYYTLDKNGEAKVPRIAIRMDRHDSIGEIRGIADHQNMEAEMMPILNEKLKEFPDRDKYYKKETDMKILTEIDNKQKNNIELSIDDLRFLYEIDTKIEGFGYETDPRINEIKEIRNIRQDLSVIYNIKEEEIAFEIDEINNNIKLFHGYLNLSSLTSAEGLVLPKKINGDLYLNSLTSAEGLVFPKEINGSLELSDLTSAEGLVLPEKINGYLNLRSLTSVEGLVLPEKINGYLNLSRLTSAEGLVLPEKINGGLYLKGLTSAEGLVLPEKINGHLDLRSLTSAEDLVLPEKINGYLDLRSLTSAEGLVLPYNFDLNGLFCNDNIKQEIRNNRELYFRHYEEDDYKII